MLPRLLSITGPLAVYVSLAVLIYGLWRERQKLDWLALVPAIMGLAASFVLLEPIHRLFFDEDIYINVAGNLSHAPVNQVTVLGAPDEIQVSSYYKEPPGWPVLLSLVFLVTGVHEAVAFWAARILYAIAIAAVFHLARQTLKNRTQSLIAAVLFGATPVCFWFSPSAGTDIAASAMSTIGMWGLLAANGPLAAAGIALAAQTRMELLILVPLVWLAKKIPRYWKLMTVSLVAVEIVHVGWVLSVAPVLERAERVQAAFSASYIPQNLRTNAIHLLNPFTFFAIVTILALIACFRAWRTRCRELSLLAAQAAGLFGVYLTFYAGSFEMNTRYSIQMLAPMTVLAASLLTPKRAILLLSVVLPYTRAYEFPGFVQALAADHRLSAEFASQISQADLVVSAQSEMFLNHGRRAMNVIYASAHKEQLEAEIGRRKVWYHAGARTGASDTEDALADGWVKSNFELHLVRSQEIRGMRIAFYEMLLKNVNRNAGLIGPFESETDRGERSGLRSELQILIHPSGAFSHGREEIFCELCLMCAGSKGECRAAAGNCGTGRILQFDRQIGGRRPRVDESKADVQAGRDFANPRNDKALHVRRAGCYADA